jgi:lipopolysaccharide transport system ATP-binding protein
MKRLAVRADGLGKSYRLGQRDPYKTIRGAITSLPARLTRRDHASTARETMWALRDLSFELPDGEALGIIGHNGAGKSTLLKLLSRVTSPTEGSAETWGRVSALLEVGTGFHLELTGRENVYLTGAVLGMSRSDITARFDDIVEFAGVGPFIDTPIKRYSSGMQVRLGFAVAAHLEPDVLIVDEVLAVGDAAFQRKCLGTLSRTAEGGRTVLFVSHNLPAVRALCSRAIVLERGQKVFEGSADDAVEFYLTSRATAVAGVGSIEELPRHRDYFLGRELTFTDLSYGTDGAEEGVVDKVLHVGDPLEARIRFRADRPLTGVVLRLTVYSLDDVMVGQAGSANEYPPLDLPQAGYYELSASIGALDLQPGRYAIGLSAMDDRAPQDEIHPVAFFDVVESLELAPVYASTGGYVRLPIRWTTPRPITADATPVSGPAT